MSVEQSKFQKLVDLAKETSSEKRRDLLREVTDIFFENEGAARTETESAMFDEIVGAVAAEMTEDIKVELSRKVATSQAPLRQTARRLATESIRVAQPVLQHAKALTNEDLVNIVNTADGQDRMMAVSKRKELAAVVSKALVKKGEDKVVASLLQNETAEIDRETFEDIAQRAVKSKELHAPFVKRKTVPLDLLNDVYEVVEQQLRRHIMVRFNTVSEAELNAALEKSKSRLNAAYGDLPEDIGQAQRWVRGEVAGNRLTPPKLIGLMRSGEKAKFLASFAHLTDVPVQTVARLVSARDIDALAILCRAAEFEKALFTSMAIQIIGGENGVSKAKGFADLYDNVPPSAAQRAVRFWKVRDKTISNAA